MSRLSRRSMILGGGKVMLSLPLLESICSPKLFAQSVDPKRFVVLMKPNGIPKDAWNPKNLSVNKYELSDILSPLQKHKEKFSIIRGLDNIPSEGGVDGSGDHARSSSCFLTCVRINKSLHQIRAGRSIDQIAAEHLPGSLTPSMQITPGGNGPDDFGYGGIYTSNISWKSPYEPAFRYQSPQKIFEFLTGNGLSDEEKASIAAKDKSILDFVTGHANDLKGKLNGSDKARLDDYLTSVRELEVTLNKEPSKEEVLGCTQIDRPEENLDFPSTTKIKLDLAVMALHCRQTSVITQILDYEFGDRIMSFIGLASKHHITTHHTGYGGSVENHNKIETFYAGILAHFLEKMDSFTESNGRTLLDNTAVLYGGSLEDSNNHIHRNLPLILAGGKGLGLNPGQHINFKNQRLSDFYIDLMKKFGIEIKSFGDSTGNFKGSY